MLHYKAANTFNKDFTTMMKIVTDSIESEAIHDKD